MLSEFAERFTGSSDLYREERRGPTASVNFLTADDDTGRIYRMIFGKHFYLSLFFGFSLIQHLHFILTFFFYVK